MEWIKEKESNRSGQELTFLENVGFFIRAVYQRKYIILIVVSLSAYAVHHFYSKQAPVYRATAKLFIGR